MGIFERRKKDQSHPYEDIPADPSTPPPPSGPFSLEVIDVFAIAGRGLVATGQVISGVVRVGDHVEVRGATGTVPCVVKGIEASRKKLASAQAGDNIGLLLSGTGTAHVARGSLVTSPR